MAVTSILNERFDTCVVIGKKGYDVILCCVYLQSCQNPHNNILFSTLYQDIARDSGLHQTACCWASDKGFLRCMLAQIEDRRNHEEKTIFEVHIEILHRRKICNVRRCACFLYSNLTWNSLKHRQWFLSVYVVYILGRDLNLSLGPSIYRATKHPDIEKYPVLQEDKHRAHACWQSKHQWPSAESKGSLLPMLCPSMHTGPTNFTFIKFLKASMLFYIFLAHLFRG